MSDKKTPAPDTGTSASGYKPPDMKDAKNNVCIGLFNTCKRPTNPDEEARCSALLKEKIAVTNKIDAIAAQNSAQKPVSEAEYREAVRAVSGYEKKVQAIRAAPNPPYCVTRNPMEGRERYWDTTLSISPRNNKSLGKVYAEETGGGNPMGAAMTSPTLGEAAAASTAATAGEWLPVGSDTAATIAAGAAILLAAKKGKTSGVAVKSKGQPAQADKNCQGCPSKGSPVNPIYGSKVLEGETDLDFTLDGPLPFAWQRTYVSGNTDTGWLGQGWSLPIAFRLDIEDEAVVFVDTQGRRTSFPRLAVGQRFFSQYEHTALQRNARNEYEIISPDGLRLIFGTTGSQTAAVEKLDADQQASAANEDQPDLDHRPPQVEVLMLRGMIDPNDNVIQLVWRADNLPHHLIDSTGRKIGFYFENERLTQVYEMHGKPGNDGRYLPSQLERIVSYQYNQQGDLIAVLDAHANPVRTFAYKNHIMVEHAEPGGVVSRYDWDRLSSMGRVTRNTLSTGEFWDFAYDDAANQTVVTDATGRRTIYHFDAEKHFTGITDPAGGFTERKLDLYGNLIALIDPAGNATRYGHDEHANLIWVKQADGATTNIAYHPQWRKPVAITDALGRTTRFTYDERGNLIGQIAADGAATQYRLNAQGLPVEIIDTKGGVIRLDYDNASRLTGYTDCSGNTTHYAYNKRGMLAHVTDAHGGRTEYGYESINRQDRVVYVKSADSAEERLAYDSLGRLIVHHDPLGQVTHYTLDAAGRPTVRTNALGHSLRYGYDVHGRLTVLHNENGVKAHFAYDMLDRLIAEQGFDGRRIDYRYNLSGHLTESIDSPNTANPIRIRYRRDKIGRLLAKIAIKRQVDEAGAPHFITARNRYAYNPLGQLTGARNPAAQIELLYNPAGQLLKEITQTRNGHHSTLEHGYDLLGNRNLTILPDGRQLNTLTYGSGHVHQINLDGQVISDIERDALHREKSRTQGALVSHFQRDGIGRLLWSHTAGATPAPLMSNAPLRGTGRAIAREYEYDHSGQLTHLHDKRQGTTQYRYDPIGRLQAARQSTLVETFAFDPAHNLLDPDHQEQAKPRKTSFTQEEWAALVKANINNPKFNPLQALDDINSADAWNDVKPNQIKVYQDKRYAYDDYGNTQEKKSGAHTVQHYAWDAEHQLRQATVTRNGIAQTFQYEYDPFGRRIAKRDSFGTTHFTWDGNRLLIEQRGQQQRLYVYEPDSFIPLAQVTLDRTPQDLPEQEDEIPAIPHEWLGMMGMYPREWKKRMKMEGTTPAQLAQEEADQRAQARQEKERQRQEQRQQAALAVYYYHTDHLGTPRELTDSQGDIRWSATYKAWGNTLKVEMVEAEAEAVPVQQAFRFQGQYFDSETGLHYNRFRYFDPDIGRFISQDPIGLEGGNNLYQYTPNPTGWVDPLGLMKCQPLSPQQKRKIAELKQRIEKHHQLGDYKGMIKDLRGTPVPRKDGPGYFQHFKEVSESMNGRNGLRAETAALNRSASNPNLCPEARAELLSAVALGESHIKTYDEIIRKYGSSPPPHSTVSF